MRSLKVFADGKTLFHVETNVIFDITRNASTRCISVTSNKIIAIYYNLRITNESLKIVLINMLQNLNRHVTINW